MPGIAVVDKPHMREPDWAKAGEVGTTIEPANMAPAIKQAGKVIFSYLFLNCIINSRSLRLIKPAYALALYCDLVADQCINAVNTI
jgi:hypothetical protein